MPCLLLNLSIIASKVFLCAIVALDSQIIEVEADISYALRRFDIVGLPDKVTIPLQERQSLEAEQLLL